MKEERQIEEERRKLRALVNEWDPFGLVKAGSPEDEYDGLSDEIYSMLNNVSEQEMIPAIALELRSHFGQEVNWESIVNFSKIVRSKTRA